MAEGVAPREGDWASSMVEWFAEHRLDQNTRRDRDGS